METKLNAYIGYVVPVLTYASQVWYPSKTDMKSIEKIQQKATKWICGGNDEYHQRLETLKILPLSMYMEMHDVLYLLSILEGNYYVPEDKLPKRKENETRQKQEFELPKHRLHKSDENFFFRATKLFNIISRTTEKPMTKKLLTEMYQNYFHRSYNELDSCTWRLLCNCGICKPMKKLVPNENWRVPHPRAPTLKTLLLLLLLLLLMHLYQIVRGFCFSFNIWIVFSSLWYGDAVREVC